MDYFSKRGITITTLGLGGGLSYAAENIQQAINQAVQDEQLQFSAKARYQSQLEENKRIQAEAEAMALAAKTKAEGEANAIKALADAKAYEINKAQSSPLYVQLRMLEIQAQTLGKWDGRLPVYQMGSSSQIPQLLMTLPDNK